jgi:hypothetical protein
MRNAYNNLVRKPEGERPLGRPRHRWEDNLRMDLRELGWEGVNWMCLTHWWALVNSVINLWVP